MELNFGNPSGFWALLGIPAVILIHFLQRKSEVLTISTLFLLDQMRRESESGSRFERLRSSIPLWLQLLMVLLLAWILSEPLWLRRDSVQRVAVILDASASMTAFKDDALGALDDALGDLASTAATTEYIVMESTGSDRRIYSGTDRGELRARAAEWMPRLGLHDPAPALRLARSLVGPQGIVLHVTDDAPDHAPPFSARTLAVGEPTANVGFAGLAIDTGADGAPVWSATIRNYGAAAESRDWWLESGEYRTTPAKVILEPGRTTTIRGPFVEGTNRVVVRLADDAFTVDDSLPIVRPRPKELTFSIDAPEDLREDLAKLFDPLEALVPYANPDPSAAGADLRTGPDLAIVTHGAASPPLPDSGAVIAFVADPRDGLPYHGERIVSANSPLVEELNWQSLLARRVASIPPQPTDEVLVWQGDFPLVFRRRTPALDLLGMNIDLRKSNATRLPAQIILLHRFVEEARARVIGDEARNVETGQDLRFAFDVSPSAGDLVLRADAGQDVAFPLVQASLIDAPSLPGFFEVRQGERRLMEGAAHFADAREADLSGCESWDDVSLLAPELIERHSRRDSLWRAWLLVLLGALIASWWYARRTREDRRPASSAADRPDAGSPAPPAGTERLAT